MTIHDGQPLYDLRVEAEAMKAAKRAAGTPKVSIFHPRTGEWSKSNQLGVELPYQLSPDRMSTILKCDEWGFPETWTVSLSAIVPELVAGQAFDLEAEISFGSGGIMQTFECDVVDGTVFSLPMNAINIRARWSDLATISGIAPPDGVRVSALLSRGSLQRSRCTKTSLFGTIAAGGDVRNNFPLIAMPPGPAVFLPIPTFAKSVVLTPAIGANAALLYAATTELQFLLNDNTAGPAVIQSVPGNLLGPTTHIPIPANARYWTVVNNGGAPIPAGPAGNSASLIWRLFDE